MGAVIWTAGVRGRRKASVLGRASRGGSRRRFGAIGPVVRAGGASGHRDPLWLWSEWVAKGRGGRHPRRRAGKWGRDRGSGGRACLRGVRGECRDAQEASR